MKNVILPNLTDFQICPPVNSSDFYELLIQLGINLFVLLIISRAIYFRWNRNPDYMFAQFVGGLTVFLICALLRWVKLELGLALGLFAIFAIIRFRTINVPVKEMAYLFLAIGISAVNALLPAGSCLQWLVLSNTLLIAIPLILETVYFSNPLTTRTITFDNTDLLKPSRHDELLRELRNLTELDIVRFHIGKTDYIKNQAQVKIYFHGRPDDKLIPPNNMNDDD